MMAANAGNLTHEEVWDDSALINSWNEALDEYKRYHSIHARGARLEDLDTAELEALQSRQIEKPDTEKEAPASVQEPDALLEPALAETAAAAEQQRNPGTAAPMMPPPAMLGTVQDEGLKKLLMSWYYAGYYTGLYEGQQQQSRQQ